MKHTHPGKKTIHVWNYVPPVSRLLTIGYPWQLSHTPDYLSLGLSGEHVPELIRMATDPGLLDLDTPTADELAPIHAWRALGQLRAVDAIDPLLGLLHRIDDNDDDVVTEEMLHTFTQIGPVAVPAISTYLADQTHGTSARMVTAEMLGRIGRKYPQARTDCVTALNRQLEAFATNEKSINGMVIWSLIDLKAVESAPLMESAFAADAVEEPMIGDWEEVQIHLGLKKRRDTPQPHYAAEQLGIPPEELQKLRNSRMFRGLGRSHTDPWEAEKRKQAKEKRKR